MLVDDEEWPFSSAHLCETFGLQPTSVRASLVAWKEARLSAEASSDAKRKPFAASLKSNRL